MATNAVSVVLTGMLSGNDLMQIPYVKLIQVFLGFFFFLIPQYYEMSYGLNIEMHKQVSNLKGEVVID